MYLGQDEPEPGTPEFGAQAAARRAAILGTPIPPTNAPPLFYLPTQMVARAAWSAAAAAGRGLFEGAGGLLMIGAVGFGLWALMRRR